MQDQQQDQQQEQATNTALGVVVIAHRQAASIALVLEALAQQLKQDDHVVVVIADASDAETFVSASASCHVTVQFADHGVTGFNAGANRDQGTNYLLGQYFDLSGIVYLDGDCVPNTQVLDSFRRLFAHTRAAALPVLGCGIRAEDNNVVDSRASAGTVSRVCRSYDCRMNSLTHGRSIFTPGVDRVMLHDRHIRSAQVCWSCHCGLNMQAIQLLRKTNSVLFGDVSRAWASVWDGNYGCEDTFVGLTVFRAGGLVVAMDPATTYVIHKQHPSSARTSKELINKQKFPLAVTQLARHLQCLHACLVLLHVRGYTDNTASTATATATVAVQAGPASTIYDTADFYNNILSVTVPPGSIEYTALHFLKLVGTEATKSGKAPNTNTFTVLEQIALFQVARTLTVAYGSGATLADILNQNQNQNQNMKQGTCSHDMCYHANSIWRTLLSTCVSVSDFLQVYNSPKQQALRAASASVNNKYIGKETESWDEETKHEVW